jgi:uncharacterized DUF497 family protein
MSVARSIGKYTAARRSQGCDFSLLPNTAIDFYEAQQLWDDPDFIEIPVTVSDESRFLIIGKISEKYWSGVITARCDISRRS